METPWVDRAPLEIVRSNIRFSLQPIDAPPDPETLNRLFDHMQSDELLLFSTDYPHWQFDGDAVLPEGMSSDLVRKIMIDNPLCDLRPFEGTGDQGDVAMNVQFRGSPEQAFVGSCENRDCRLRHPSGARHRDRTLSLSGKALACASRDLRQACLSGHDGRPALSEGAAQRVAPRRLSAGRRPSRARRCRSCSSSISTRTMSCSACSIRSPPGRASAITILPRRSARRSTTGRSTKWTSKDSRLKGSVVVANEDGTGAAAEIRKRAGDANFVQVLLLSRNCRAARPAPLLADLRGGGRGGASGRRARLRLRRQPDHRLGLAELLHRGDGRPFAVPADRAREHRAGRRVRAASDAQDDHDRGRLRLGAVAVVAARQELAAVARARCRM